MKKLLYILPLLLLWLTACEDQPLDDPTASLVFSADTVSFDTVFTSAGSATRSVIIRNPYKRALTISRVSLESGISFRINLDGETCLDSLHNITIPGGDSLFLFVRATIDPADRTQPLLTEDNVLFEVGNHQQALHLQAYAWDAEWIDSLEIRHDTTFLGEKPYLVRHWILVDSTATLRLAPGCQFYMHDGAQWACYGSMIAEGTLDEPILFSSDRLDDLYDDIPYLYVGGKWDGIYLVRPDSAYFSHTEIISGNVGLYLLGSGEERLTLLDSRIHNQALYGLVLQQTDALVANTEISNCAQYCVYLSSGRFDFVHCTIASYFNATRYAVQTVAREDSISPLYINNLSKQRRKTELHFLNSVLAGAKKNCLMLANPLPAYYSGELAFSYLQTDTLRGTFAHDIVYGERSDTVFVNTYYDAIGHYYDFSLDSLSRVRDIGDSLIATRYPLDRLGRNRLLDGHPDAGCYEYSKE